MDDVTFRFMWAMWDMRVAFIHLLAQVDGSREGFIADGGDPEEIRRLEEAFVG